MNVTMRSERFSAVETRTKEANPPCSTDRQLEQLGAGVAVGHALG